MRTKLIAFLSIAVCITCIVGGCKDKGSSPIESNEEVIVTQSQTSSTAAAEEDLDLTDMGEDEVKNEVDMFKFLIQQMEDEIKSEIDLLEEPTEDELNDLKEEITVVYGELRETIEEETDGDKELLFKLLEESEKKMTGMLKN